MRYLKKVETWFEDLLFDATDQLPEGMDMESREHLIDSMAPEIQDKILEVYRQGQKNCLCNQSSKPCSQKPMNYLKQVDAWLEEKLRRVNSAVEDTEEVIAEVKREIKEKILESYRNGQEYGKKRQGSTEAVRQTTYQHAKPRRKRQAYAKRN